MHHGPTLCETLSVLATSVDTPAVRRSHRAWRLDASFTSKLFPRDSPPGFGTVAVKERDACEACYEMQQLLRQLSTSAAEWRLRCLRGRCSPALVPLRGRSRARSCGEPSRWGRG